MKILLVLLTTMLFSCFEKKVIFNRYSDIPLKGNFIKYKAVNNETNHSSIQPYYYNKFKLDSSLYYFTTELLSSKYRITYKYPSSDLRLNFFCEDSLFLEDKKYTLNYLLGNDTDYCSSYYKIELKEFYLENNHYLIMEVYERENVRFKQKILPIVFIMNNQKEWCYLENTKFLKPYVFFNLEDRYFITDNSNQKPLYFIVIKDNVIFQIDINQMKESKILGVLTYIYNDTGFVRKALIEPGNVH